MISARSEEGLGDNVDSKPSVSFVIVTYNSEDDINLCLNSLEPHLRDGLGEAVIIDNASRDETASVINSWSAAEFTFIENSANAGFTKAVNQGIAQSRGEFVYILNPDTQLAENCIDGLIQRFKSNAEIAAVAPQLRFPDGRIQYSCRRFPTHGNVIGEIRIPYSSVTWTSVRGSRTPAGESSSVLKRLLHIREAVPFLNGVQP